MVRGKLTPLQLENRKQLASRWEQSFEWHWKLLPHPKPRLTRQARIIPDRQFAFDFAFPDSMVAVELDGGTFGSRSGHNTGLAIERCYEKANEAAKLGWCVLRYGTKRMEKDMHTIVEEVLTVVKSRSGEVKGGGA